MESWRDRADRYQAAGCKVDEPDWDELLFPERKLEKARQGEKIRQLYQKRGLIRG